MRMQIFLIIFPFFNKLLVHFYNMAPNMTRKLPKTKVYIILNLTPYYKYMKSLHRN